MACRKVLLNLGKLPRISVRAASGQTTGVPYPAPETENVKKATHTGQMFPDDDYRNVRFTNATRYVNQNFAIELIDEVPPKECTERVVSCDGGGGPLGHPKVYINLDKPGAHACGYCGLRFVKKDHHH
uniref:Putative ubiquinone oxidoreductase ndufs6/13 kDa subunit n=1 Tax=Phlebotomus kandelakii TaxID=1109342 RepID=A0A6B2EJD4_9DIPT